MIETSEMGKSGVRKTAQEAFLGACERARLKQPLPCRHHRWRKPFARDSGCALGWFAHTAVLPLQRGGLVEGVGDDSGKKSFDDHKNRS